MHSVCTLFQNMHEILDHKHMGHGLIVLSGSRDVVGRRRSIPTDSYLLLQTAFGQETPFSHNMYVTDDRQTDTKL